MQKKSLKLVLCLLVVILNIKGVSMYGNRCTIQRNVQFNVLIEGVIETPYGTQYWMGSGVIIDKDGIIVTAKHCVEGADFIKVTLQDGRAYIVNTWLMDEDRDVAVFQIPVEFDDVATIGNSNLLQQGDEIYNVGNPLGIWENKVAVGEVEKNNFERLAFCEDGDFIFVKIDIKPGCSGGGVYYKAKLIGIVSLGAEGISFLIPSEDIQELLDKYNGILL